MDKKQYVCEYKNGDMVKYKHVSSDNLIESLKYFMLFIKDGWTIKSVKEDEPNERHKDYYRP